MDKLPLRPEVESQGAAYRSVFEKFHVRFRPLPVALTFVTIGLMVALGFHIVQRFRDAQLHSYGRIAEVYVSQYLAPYALALRRDGSSEPVRFDQITEALDRAVKRGQSLALQIWSVDGKILYSSSPVKDATRHDGSDLTLAIAGDEVAHFEEGTDDTEGVPLPSPFLEIYLPIRDPKTSEIIAVGELYLDATEITADIGSFERNVWLAILLSTLAVLAMLAASARQSEQLRTFLAAEQHFSALNDALRLQAELARLDASTVHEETMNLLGAELHDGPVQILGLAALMSPPETPAVANEGLSQKALINQAMTQLRKMSSGLILPEIEQLDLDAVIDSAVALHRALQDSPLVITSETEGARLDLRRRICTYRVIQEGLTNARRHGDNGEVRLAVRAIRRTLSITIISRQAHGSLPSSKGPTDQLGLQAMRRRLAPFDGTAVLRRFGDVAVLKVLLPLDDTGQA